VPAASPRDRDLSLILEILARVAFNAATTVVNGVVQTVVDLPVVQPCKPA
jgi:hypothetical protein